MTSLEHPLIKSYLQAVSDALRAAEPERRNEILEQIADHIVAATSQLAPDDEIGLLEVLDRLGPPADIAAAADLPPYGMPSPSPVAPAAAATLSGPPAPSGTSERWALAALLVSPVLCVVGWVVGVVLLWTSRIWTTRHKVIGTVATLPFALMFVLVPMVLLTSGRSTSSIEVTQTSIEATPTTTGGASAPTVDQNQRSEAPQVTSTTATQPWTPSRVLAIAGWAIVLLVMPIGTIIWLGRALKAYTTVLEPPDRAAA